jgi:membrane associated rhomboid family serine protease
MSTPSTPATNAFRARLPIVVIAAVIFVVLLVITAITENNGMGTAVAIYGIVGGILLGRLLATTERERMPANDA